MAAPSSVASSDEALFEALVAAEMQRLRREAGGGGGEPPPPQFFGSTASAPAPAPVPAPAPAPVPAPAPAPAPDDFDRTGASAGAGAAAARYRAQMSGNLVMSPHRAPASSSSDVAQPSIALGGRGGSLAANKARNERPTVAAVGPQQEQLPPERLWQQQQQQQHQQQRDGSDAPARAGVGRRSSYLGESALPLPGEGGAKGVGAQATYRIGPSSSPYQQYQQYAPQQDFRPQPQPQQPPPQPDSEPFLGQSLNLREVYAPPHAPPPAPPSAFYRPPQAPQPRSQPDLRDAERAAMKAAYAAELIEQMNEVAARKSKLREADELRERLLVNEVPSLPGAARVRARGKKPQPLEQQLQFATSARPSELSAAEPPGSPRISAPFALSGEPPLRSPSPQRVREVAGNMDAESVRQAVLRGDKFARFRVENRSPDELSKLALRQRAQAEQAADLERQIEERQQLKANEERRALKQEAEDERKLARDRQELARRERSTSGAPSTLSAAPRVSSASAIAGLGDGIDERVVGPRSQLKSPPAKGELADVLSGSGGGLVESRALSIALPPTAVRLLQLRAKVATARDGGGPAQTSSLRATSPPPEQVPQQHQLQLPLPQPQLNVSAAEQDHGPDMHGYRSGDAVRESGGEARESFNEAVAAYAQRIVAAERRSGGVGSGGSAFDGAAKGASDSLSELSRARRLQEEMAWRLEENSAVMARVQGALQGLSQQQQVQMQQAQLHQSGLGFGGDSHAQFGGGSDGFMQLPGSSATFDGGLGFQLVQPPPPLQQAPVALGLGFRGGGQPPHLLRNQQLLGLQDDSLFAAAAALDAEGGGSFAGAVGAAPLHGQGMPRRPVIGGSALPSNHIPGGADGADLFIRWVGRGRPLTAAPKASELQQRMAEAERLQHEAQQQLQRDSRAYLPHNAAHSDHLRLDEHEHERQSQHEHERQSQHEHEQLLQDSSRRETAASIASGSRPETAEVGSFSAALHSHASHAPATAPAPASPCAPVPSAATTPHLHVFGADASDGAHVTHTARKAPFSGGATSSRSDSAARARAHGGIALQAAQRGAGHESTAADASRGTSRGGAAQGHVDASMDSSTLLVFVDDKHPPPSQPPPPSRAHPILGRPPTSEDVERQQRQPQQQPQPQQRGRLPAPQPASPAQPQSFTPYLSPRPQAVGAGAGAGPAAEAAAILKAGGLRSSMTDYYGQLATESATARSVDGEGLPQSFGEQQHRTHTHVGEQGRGQGRASGYGEHGLDHGQNMRQQQLLVQPQLQLPAQAQAQEQHPLPHPLAQSGAPPAPRHQAQGPLALSAPQPHPLPPTLQPQLAQQRAPVPVEQAPAHRDSVSRSPQTFALTSAAPRASGHGFADEYGASPALSLGAEDTLSGSTALRAQAGSLSGSSETRPEPLLPHHSQQLQQQRPALLVQAPAPTLAAASARVSISPSGVQPTPSRPAPGPSSPPGTGRLRPTSAAIARVGSARPASSSSAAAAAAAAAASVSAASSRPPSSLVAGTGGGGGTGAGLPVGSLPATAAPGVGGSPSSSPPRDAAAAAAAAAAKVVAAAAGGSRNSPSSISLAEIQAALHQGHEGTGIRVAAKAPAFARPGSGSMSPGGLEAGFGTAPYARNMSVVEDSPALEASAAAISDADALAPQPQPPGSSLRLGSSPALTLAQIADDEHEEEKEERDEGKVRDSLHDGQGTGAGAAPLAAAPATDTEAEVGAGGTESPGSTLREPPPPSGATGLDGSADDSLASARLAHGGSASDAHARRKSWGLTPLEVEEQKRALLAFYTKEAPAKARPARIDEAFELFGLRIWSELRGKYGADKVDSFEPRLLPEEAPEEADDAPPPPPY